MEMSTSFSSYLYSIEEPVEVDYIYHDCDEDVGDPESYELTVIDSNGKDITDELTQDDYEILENEASKHYIKLCRY